MTREKRVQVFPKPKIEKQASGPQGTSRKRWLKEKLG